MQTNCESSITHVAVHARGAVVTRRVSAPEQPLSGQSTLLVGGVTLLAEPSSFRARVSGARLRVVSVSSRVDIKTAGALVSAPAQRLRDIDLRIRRLEDERGRLDVERRALLSLRVSPLFRFAGGAPPVPSRMAGALASSSLIDELVAEADERDASLARELLPLRRERDALALSLTQGTASERGGEGKPSRTAVVVLSGEGQPSSIEVSYVVPAARWWPVYTLYLEGEGKRAELLFEAIVAQRSAESWAGVSLTLSSGDLQHDARLPELSSLRLGRAQAAPRRGYRPPPEGLERMFEGHDRSFIAREPPKPAMPSSSTRLAEEARAAPSKTMTMAGMAPPGAADMLTRAGTVMPSFGAAGGAAPAPAPQAAAPKGKRIVLRDRLGKASMAKRDADEGYEEEEAEEDEEAEEGGAAPVAAHVGEPEAIWLDFSRLELRGPRAPQRGKLARVNDETTRDRHDAVRSLEVMTPMPLLRDPQQSRGLFAHRYEAEGKAIIPDDGAAHRVRIRSASGVPSIRYRAVPREGPEVYREAVLTNPTGAPLLGGPVQVYLDGSLLAVTEVDRVGQGGTLTVAMGVEERVTTARNCQASEGSAGLLGGSLAITQTVTIDVRSSLSHPITLEVFERRPVSDDKNVEIKALGARPEPSAYDQAERGAPVRGGLRFTVQLPPHGKSQIEHQYRVTIPAKYELVGGNRRE